jgi:hypothetical protein
MSFRSPKNLPTQDRSRISNVRISLPDRGHCAPRHIDNRPNNDEFFDTDFRAMGRSVLVGYIQIL